MWNNGTDDSSDQIPDGIVALLLCPVLMVVIPFMSFQVTDVSPMVLKLAALQCMFAACSSRRTVLVDTPFICVFISDIIWDAVVLCFLASIRFKTYDMSMPTFDHFNIIGKLCLSLFAIVTVDTLLLPKPTKVPICVLVVPARRALTILPLSKRVS